METVDINGIRCYMLGNVPYVSVSAGLNQLYPMSPFVKQHHLDAGSIHHDWMDKYLKAKLAGDQEYRNHLYELAPPRVKRAFDWANVNIDRVEAVEETCFHPMGIACTRDFRGYVDRQHEVIDWKFTATAGERYKMQVAIYWLFDPVPDNASLVLIPKEGPVRRKMMTKEPALVAKFIQAVMPLIQRVRNQQGG